MSKKTHKANLARAKANKAKLVFIPATEHTMRQMTQPTADDHIMVAGVEVMTPEVTYGDVYAFAHPTTGARYDTKNMKVAAALEVLFGVVLMRESLTAEHRSLAAYINKVEPNALDWMGA